MDKTYKLLDHTEPMSEDEIRELYKGYWVYIVKAKYSKEIAGELITGIPVVIGKVPYDGVDDGIYEKYRGDEYNKRLGMSLLPNTGFISSLRFVG